MMRAGHRFTALAGAFLALMIYVTLPQLQAQIPAPFLTQALDDDGDGVIDQFDAVAANASSAVEALLAGRYNFPLPDPQPQILGTAALYFAAEMCYQRRGHFGELNPFTAMADRLRKQLAAIGLGEAPLAPDAQRALPSATLVGERSKVHSGRGPLGRRSGM